MSYLHSFSLILLIGNMRSMPITKVIVKVNCEVSDALASTLKVNYE